jgi:hypothetical protein
MLFVLWKRLGFLAFHGFPALYLLQKVRLILLEELMREFPFQIVYLYDRLGSGRENETRGLHGSCNLPEAVRVELSYERTKIRVLEIFW